MNLSDARNWVSIFISCVVLSGGCKHETEEAYAYNLNIIADKKNYAEGDTVHFSLLANTEPVAADSWSFSHGTSFSDGTWLAPPHIDSPDIVITLQVFYQRNTLQKTFTLRKKALEEPLVSFNQTIKPLLVNNCNFTGCHGNGSRAGKVELSTYDSARKHTIPFNAESSRLYYSLIKTDPLRVMPPAGKLHDTKIKQVWLWIEQGALSN